MKMTTKHTKTLNAAKAVFREKFTALNVHIRKEERWQINNLFFNFFKFTYFERKTERASGGGAEREGEGESQAGRVLPVQSPTWNSNSQTESPRHPELTIFLRNQNKKSKLNPKKAEKEIWVRAEINEIKI